MAKATRAPSTRLIPHATPAAAASTTITAETATTVTRVGLSVGPERARLIHGRLTEIAIALRIPRPAVDAAMSSDAKLIAFIYATNQSLDWVVRGDLSSTIRALHRGGRECWAPSHEALVAVGVK